MTSPESYTGIVGEQAVLRCRVRGFPVSDILWLKDGEAVNSSRIGITRHTLLALSITSNLTTTGFEVSDAGNYTCIASNDLASIQYATSQEAILTVHGKIL